MSPRLVELALKKQRLQMQSAALRAAFADHARAWTPALAAVDRVRLGVAWLRRHPALPVTVLVAALVARPRAVLRLAGRGWLVWGVLKRLRATAEAALALVPGAAAGRR